MVQKLILENSWIENQLLMLNPIELQRVLDNVFSFLTKKEEYIKVLEKLKINTDRRESKIVLKTNKQHYVLLTKDIIHLKAEGSYTCFYTTTQKIMVSRNLKYYQNILNKRFTRCHQSHLINSEHILGIDKKGLILLTNDERVRVSSRKRAAIIKMISGYNILRKVE